MRKAASILLILAGIAMAGDWLSERGDPKCSGWQRTGKQITVENVKDLRLLWSRRLDSSTLSSPVILGPTITFRGVRELVFVTGRGGDLYAVDADFGTVFWKRHFDVAGKSVLSGAPVTPAIEPDEDYDPTDESEEEEGDSAPMRPLYVLTSDGMVHTVRVSDGADTAAATRLVPANRAASGLNVWGGKVQTLTSGSERKADRATWLDSKQVRWFFESDGRGVRGFRGASRVWTADLGSFLRPPVVTNGVVFALSPAPAVLRAFDALTGKVLFASHEEIGGTDSYVALANGHVCFTAQNSLFCYGIPIER
jgi:outer membrane protein assembly factor BamB